MEEISTTIYHYQNETGEFITTGVARINPLDETNVLVPASATTTEPPEAKEGFKRCFVNNQWIYKVDNRGVVKYIGQELVVFALGDEITAAMTDKPTLPLPDLKAEKNKQINIAYYQSCNNYVDVLDNLKLRGNPEIIKTLYIDIKLSELSGATTLDIVDSDNVSHILSVEDALQIAIKMWQLYKKREQHKALLMRAVNSSENADAINSIVVDFSQITLESLESSETPSETPSE
jgi:hypothetical protein